MVIANYRISKIQDQNSDNPNPSMSEQFIHKLKVTPMTTTRTKGSNVQKTNTFLTHQSEQDNEQPCANIKKYPDTWKNYILPELRENAPRTRESNREISRYNSKVTFKQVQFKTPQQTKKVYSRTLTQATEGHEYDGKINLVGKLRIAQKSHKTKKELIGTERHRHWTGRIVLENQYSKEQADYLRQMFTHFLLERHKLQAAAKK